VLTRLIGQAVKTPPSHGGNRGSIPLSAVSSFEEPNPEEVLKQFVSMLFCFVKKP
jgi:hypothetical protein